MVLHYLKDSIPNRGMPHDLVDDNVRIDYGKLRHLVLMSQQGPRKTNGNFDMLRQVAAQGRALTKIRRSFPPEHLSHPENFLSLLYYFGLLSIEGEKQGLVRLGIPNQTVRHLLYGYIREAYRDVNLFSPDLHRLSLLLSRMAFRGEWRPLIDFLSTAIAEQTAIRDYIAGEKVLQGFFAAYFGLSEMFLMRSEGEIGKGYADLVLEPFTARYPDMGYGYVIELKYIRRGEMKSSVPPTGNVSSDVKDAAASGMIATRLTAARAQLRRYLADPVFRNRSAHFIGLALIFHGWELVACESVAATDDGARGRRTPAFHEKVDHADAQP